MRRTIALMSCGLLMAACGGTKPVQVSFETGPSDSGASGTASASATPEAAPPTTSPLSGRTGGVDAPVLVVKLDNTPSAQPHVNLVDADIVYVEPVEWGLTRLAAVYSSRIPTAVGPVRSARISDIQVFAPYGNIAFVYSGAQQRLQPKLEAADWTPVSEDLDSQGFHRDYGRPSPYNLMAEPQVILDNIEDVATASDMGLVFDSERLAGGERAKVVSAQWENARMQFRWRAKNGAYDVWTNGRQARDTAEQGVQRATTVIVQYVKEVDSSYGDKFGGVTPRSITVGSGTGLLLRDGWAHPITWERNRVGAATTYLDADGQPIILDPGQVWILLKDRRSKVSYE